MKIAIRRHYWCKSESLKAKSSSEPSIFCAKCKCEIGSKNTQGETFFYICGKNIVPYHKSCFEQLPDPCSCSFCGKYLFSYGDDRFLRSLSLHAGYSCWILFSSFAQSFLGKVLTVWHLPISSVTSEEWSKFKVSILGISIIIGMLVATLPKKVGTYSTSLLCLAMKFPEVTIPALLSGALLGGLSASFIQLNASSKEEEHSSKNKRYFWKIFLGFIFYHISYLATQASSEFFADLCYRVVFDPEKQCFDDSLLLRMHGIFVTLACLYPLECVSELPNWNSGATWSVFFRRSYSFPCVHASLRLIEITFCSVWIISLLSVLFGKDDFVLASFGIEHKRLSENLIACAIKILAVIGGSYFFLPPRK